MASTVIEVTDEMVEAGEQAYVNWWWNDSDERRKDNLIVHREGLRRVLVAALVEAGECRSQPQRQSPYGEGMFVVRDPEKSDLFWVVKMIDGVGKVVGVAESEVSEITAPAKG